MPPSQSNIHNWERVLVRWKLQGVSYNVPKVHELWSTNADRKDRCFHASSVNAECCFLATKFCDMLENEPDLRTHVKICGVLSPENCGAKTAYFETVFSLTKLYQMPKSKTGVLSTLRERR